MGFVWAPVGAYSVAVALVAVAFAVAVYALRPQNLQNRYVALDLAGEAVWLFGGTGLIYLTDDPAAVVASQTLTVPGAALFLAAYLCLLGTLRTPLTRPLRARGVPAVLFTAAGVVGILVLLWPERFVAGVVDVPYAALDAVAGPWLAFFPRAFVVVASFGVVAAFDAWRRLPRASIERRQARAFLVAFGVRDLLLLLIFGRGLLGDPLAVVDGLFSPLAPRFFAGQQWLPTQVLAFVLLVSYGMLKAQLFDVDLRLKWTLRRGTLVGAFVAVFVVVAAVVEQWLQQYGVLVGGVAVGLMLLTLRPLERAADRLADAAMPRVQDNAEYRLVRKREVYRAAVESALSDGVIDERERDLLATLVEHLGLKPTDARAIERDAAGRTQGVP